MNPLDRLTEVISRLMGKEPSDPDVMKAVVEVVMAMREPSQAMLDYCYGQEIDWGPGGSGPDEEQASPELIWRHMIDALLTEGEG